MAQKALSAPWAPSSRQIHRLAWALSPTSSPARQTFPPRNAPICIQCQLRRPFSSSSQQARPAAPARHAPPTRSFSSSPSRLDDNPSPPSPKPAPGPSKLAHRLEHLTTQLLQTLSAISHRLNIYTGTDYTPISTVRANIASQEAAIKPAHAAVGAARAAHAAAQATQSASQKEVVQLLERKHSWTGPDLERYMALIRSEHENERAVAAARADAAAAERALEQHRHALERLERLMYHEEQVWSDTIRRNSTWVTFGLMGVNLLLLLGNVVLVEPWRRRRMVAEIKGVMDDRPRVLDAVPPPPHTTSSPAALADDIQADAGSLGASALEAEAEAESLPAVAVDDPPPATGGPLPASWTSTAARLQHGAADLFSARPVTLRRVDATAGVLSGAAVGASGMLVVLWAAGALVRDFY